MPCRFLFFITHYYGAEYTTYCCHTRILAYYSFLFSRIVCTITRHIFIMLSPALLSPRHFLRSFHFRMCLSNFLIMRKSILRVPTTNLPVYTQTSTNTYGCTHWLMHTHACRHKWIGSKSVTCTLLISGVNQGLFHLLSRVYQSKI